MTNRLREALAELVALEADGKQAAECAIEAWERAREALSALSGAGVQPTISDAFDVARAALMACPDRGSSRRILEVLHERVKDALVSAAIPKAEPGDYPPLPAPEYYCDNCVRPEAYTAEQMRAYIDADRVSRPQPADAQQPSDKRDEDDQYTLDRAADLLEHYAEFIDRAKPDEIEEHPYLPELQMIVKDLRVYAASEANLSEAAINRAAEKTASRTEFGEVIFPVGQWEAFVAALASRTNPQQVPCDNCTFTAGCKTHGSCRIAYDRAGAPQQAEGGPARRLNEAEIEDCIDRANRKFNGRRQGPSGQQLTSYDDWRHWLAREVEDTSRAAATAPAGDELHRLIDRAVADARIDQRDKTDATMQRAAESRQKAITAAYATAPAGGVTSGAYLRKKAEDYAMEYGSDDMGGLSFGSGAHAEVKMDHYNNLLELADELDTITTAARAAEPEGWKPIETAPQGTIVLMCDLQARDVAGFMYVDWVVEGKCCGNRHRTPTHWTQLPTPPTGTSKEGGE